MYGRWLSLAVLTFARIAVGFQFQSVSAVSHLLIEKFHIGYAVFGTLIGFYLLPGIAVALPGVAMLALASMFPLLFEAARFHFAEAAAGLGGWCAHFGHANEEAALKILRA